MLFLEDGKVPSNVIANLPRPALSVGFLLVRPQLDHLFVVHVSQPWNLESWCG